MVSEPTERTADVIGQRLSARGRVLLNSLAELLPKVVTDPEPSADTHEEDVAVTAPHFLHRSAGSESHVRETADKRR